MEVFTGDIDCSDLIQGEVFHFLQEYLEIFPNKYISMIYRNLLHANLMVQRKLIQNTPI